MKISAVTTGQPDDFLETIASKYTRKNYVNGIKCFQNGMRECIKRDKFSLVWGKVLSPKPKKRNRYHF
jgi:hypothetical protein